MLEFRPMRGIAMLATLTLIAGAASADRDNDNDKAKARLSGFHEVPSLASAASGIEATLTDESIEYELSYRGLEGSVTQAHIHLGQKGVNGGISVFLCSNLGTPGTQPCPASGTVRGTLTSASVIGPAAQNIAPGEMAKLLKAVRAWFTYAQVTPASSRRRSAGRSSLTTTDGWKRAGPVRTALCDDAQQRAKVRKTGPL